MLVETGPIPAREPYTEVVLDALLPVYVQSRVFNALLQSSAAKHAATQKAMESASDNAYMAMQAAVDGDDGPPRQLAGRRQRDPPRRPGEEGDAELVLQPPDRRGERLLGEMQAFARPGEVELLGDREEVAQLA